MNKKTIILILLLIVVATGGLSLYSTFAYDEESEKLGVSEAEYNLIYSLKEKSNKQISLSSKEEKYIDIELTNTYSSNIRYGMYYSIINPNKTPEGLNITLALDSTSSLEEIIKPNQTKTISIKINNDSNYNVDLIVGALIGFENGNIQELVGENEILIK